MSDLAALGLSSYESKVYRALLGLGSAPAREISTTSEVPKGRIYDVLNALDGRGLVRTHDSREPTQYAAVDPDIAVDRLLSERKRELAAQRQHYESVAETVSERLAAAIPTESRFWTAGLGSDTALSLFEEQLELADTRIISAISVPYENAAWSAYAAELDPIERLLDPDIDVDLLVSGALVERVPESIQRDVFDLTEGVTVRSTPNLTISVDVVDSHTVYVHVSDPFDPSERLGIVAVRDETFATTLETAFDDIWDAAARIDQA